MCRWRITVITESSLFYAYIYAENSYAAMQTAKSMFPKARNVFVGVAS